MLQKHEVQEMLKFKSRFQKVHVEISCKEIKCLGL